MGKSNRIRASRANEKIQTLGAKPKKKGMPGWVMTLITVVLAVSLLLSVVAITLTANGVFGRMSTVVTSENYKVDANMMSFFYNTQYQNFISNYESMLTGDNGSGNISLNPNLPLKDQQVGGGALDSLYCGDFKGTWYDFFMKSAVDSVKATLVYCEYAKANNITLGEEEIEQIDTSMSNYQLYATLYGYPSISSFLSAQFGDGVSEGDVRKCMELSMLSEKAMNVIVEEINDSVTEKDVNDRYGKDGLKYDLVDYTFYEFTVNYDEIAAEVVGKTKPTDAEIAAKKDEILAAYKAAVEKAKNEAEELKGKTDIKDFQLFIYQKVANETFDTLYGNQTIKDEIKPNLGEGVDAKEFFKDKIVADVIEEILADKTEADVVVEIPEEEDKKEDDNKESDAEPEKTADEKTTLTAYDKEVDVEYAKILNTLKSGVFNQVKTTKTTNIIEKKTYKSESDKFSVWAFDTARKVGDITTIATGDGSKEDEEITNKSGKSTTTVYFLTKDRYKDEELSRKFTYMIFSSETTAKEAIKALTDGKTFTVEAFEKIAEDKKASNVESVTDYKEGQFGVADFDKWLFDEKTTAGSITATPIKTSSTSASYIVALYEGTGDALWYIDVKSTIASERAEAKDKELTEKYAITVKENNYNKVNVVGE